MIRVDWDFLEGTMLRIGFPMRWIHAISALYRHASSVVTIGGFLGQSFAISRSVRQGCPLAPYLFLFLAETMHSFLHRRTPHITGLHLPMAGHRDLLDSQFADDTMLYVTYSIQTLDSLRDAIHCFSTASSARINWNTLYGNLIGSEHTSN